jgi:hypothetical protein
MERKMYEGFCSKKPFALVITASTVSVKLFLAARVTVGILTEDQQDLHYKFFDFCGSRKGGFTNLGHCLLRVTV